MNSRLEASGTSSSKKRNMEHSKQDKKNGAPFKAAAPAKPNITLTETRNTTTAVATHFSADERQRMIEEAAFYRAEKRAFDGGNEVDDWLEAEAEINARYPE